MSSLFGGFHEETRHLNILDHRLFGERRLLTGDDFRRSYDDDYLFTPEMQPLEHSHWIKDKLENIMAEAKAGLNRQLEAHVRTMQEAFGDRLDQFRLLLGRVKTQALHTPGDFTPQGLTFTQSVRVVHISQLEQAMRAFGEEHTVYEVKHP